MFSPQSWGEKVSVNFLLPLFLRDKEAHFLALKASPAQLAYSSRADNMDGRPLLFLVTR